MRWPLRRPLRRAELLPPAHAPGHPVQPLAAPCRAAGRHPLPVHQASADRLVPRHLQIGAGPERHVGAGAGAVAGRLHGAGEREAVHGRLLPRGQAGIPGALPSGVAVPFEPPLRPNGYRGETAARCRCRTRCSQRSPSGRRRAGILNLAGTPSAFARGAEVGHESPRPSPDGAAGSLPARISRASHGDPRESDVRLQIRRSATLTPPDSATIAHVDSRHSLHLPSYSSVLSNLDAGSGESGKLFRLQAICIRRRAC